MNYVIDVRASFVDENDEFTETAALTAIRVALSSCNAQSPGGRLCIALAKTVRVTRARPPEPDPYR